MNDRRRRTRARRPASGEIHVAVEREKRALQAHKVKLADVSDWGVGFETSTPMVMGARLFVWGPALPTAKNAEHRRKVQEMHCRLIAEGIYRAGCASEDKPTQTLTVRPDV